MCNQTKKCDECGKESQHITECTYPINDDITNLCPQCLKEDGSFCLSCGMFCAGMTNFDFIHPGYCDTCWDEIEVADWDNDDEEYPDGSLDY